MTIQNSILACNSMNAVANLLSKQEFNFKLDRFFGWEKIITESGEEYFNLMRTSAHLHQLCRKDIQKLKSKDVEQAKKVCEVFLKFWQQLANELYLLNDLALTAYRTMHANRYLAIFCDDNEEWLNFWQKSNSEQAETMLKPSYYIFDALQNLEKI